MEKNVKRILTIKSKNGNIWIQNYKRGMRYDEL